LNYLLDMKMVYHCGVCLTGVTLIRFDGEDFDAAMIGDAETRKYHQGWNIGLVLRVCDVLHLVPPECCLDCPQPHQCDDESFRESASAYAFRITMPDALPVASTSNNDSISVRYQYMCMATRKAELERARVESDWFLERFFAEKAVHPYRVNYISLLQWPSSMERITESVAAMNRRGGEWNMTLKRISVEGHRRADFTGAICMADRDRLGATDTHLLSYVNGLEQHSDKPYHRCQPSCLPRVQDKFWTELLYECGQGQSTNRDIDVLVVVSAQRFPPLPHLTSLCNIFTESKLDPLLQ
jgi:hypothetical protein